MQWYSIDMPRDSLTNGGYHRLCRRFQRAFIDAGAPADLALFAMRGSDNERRIYLSPVSVTYVPDLIRTYGASPCEVPAASTVTLVYGAPGAQKLLESPDQPAEPSDENPSRITAHPHL